MLELDALGDEVLMGEEEVPSYLQESEIPSAPVYLDEPTASAPAAPQTLDEFGLPVAEANAPSKLTA